MATLDKNAGVPLETIFFKKMTLVKKSQKSLSGAQSVSQSLSS